jgi:hypothetical protein
VQGLHLWLVEEAVAPALGQVQGVDRQGPHDQVAAGEAGGQEQLVELLAGVARQRAAGEQVVVGGLVGQDDQAEVLEAAAGDRADAEGGVGGDAEGGEVGPAEAGFAAEQQRRARLAGGPRSKAVAAARGGSYGRSPASSL